MKTFVMTLSVLALSILGFSPFPASAENSIKLEKDAHAGSQSFPFTLPPLPYAYGALAPFIDARTMEIHYNRHHKGYVDNLNKAVEGNAEASGKTLTEILSGISAYDNAIRNNAGGHWNHSFFWSIMAPHSMESTIPTDLHNAIEAEFGSIDRFKQAFEQAGTARFGSGWVWLVVDENGKLGIISTPNQDNPLMGDASVRATPILGNDVWEHAYYLNYQNKRNEYLKNWWSVVNWEQVAKNYRAAK